MRSAVSPLVGIGTLPGWSWLWQSAATHVLTMSVNLITSLDGMVGLRSEREISCLQAGEALTTHLPCRSTRCLTVNTRGGVERFTGGQKVVVSRT